MGKPMKVFLAPEHNQLKGQLTEKDSPVFGRGHLSPHTLAAAVVVGIHVAANLSRIWSKESHFRRRSSSSACPKKIP